MRYLPIAPRLQRLYLTKNTAKQMTWRYEHQKEPGLMVHPSDGEARKHFDSMYPEFSSEPRNVRLGLCTDGFSPNNSNTTPYSCWHVFLSIYNLPPWMCLKEPYVQLSIVIPGKKSPGQNIDVFLRPLIDELKMLYIDSVVTYDASTKCNFTMKAILLWTVSDFPAYAMLSGWSIHGKLACLYCMGFLANKVERSSPPPILTGDQIWEQVRHFSTAYEGKPFRAKNAKLPGFGITHNWVKRSIIWELPYLWKLLIRNNLDPMHIETNVFENIFNTVMDTPKSKDNMNARKDIKMYCNRVQWHTWKKGNKDMKKRASFALSKEKSHECHVFLQRFLPISLRDDLQRSQTTIVETICKLEKIFPPGFFDSMEHLVIHLAREAMLGGPVQYRWIYLYERLSIKHFQSSISKIIQKSGQQRPLTDDEMRIAHNYILINCVEVLPFLRLFENYVIQSQPDMDDRAFERFRDQHFAKWFKDHVSMIRAKFVLLKFFNNQMLSVNILNALHEDRYDMLGPIKDTLSMIECDYYGLLDEVLEVEYQGIGRCVVVLFKCTWLNPTEGVRVDQKHNLVDIKHKSRLRNEDPFILASQAEQVYYAPYPAMKDLKDWWVVVKTKPRGVYDLRQCVTEEDDDEDEEDQFF
ncbi:uncharacterized protein LOC128127643 [Lactuca sativa]|uniref:uncharacterized protein LOC128127643 n=1 Tax=Lactuca sativa TaxID=4236 RepID=UPI000CD8CBB3|nr:uncharacterized protein LOC128127643 [Lactuca sativa]